MSNGLDMSGGLSAGWAEMLAHGINPANLGQSGRTGSGFSKAGALGGAGGGFSTQGSESGGTIGGSQFSQTGQGGNLFEPGTASPGELTGGAFGGTGLPSGLGANGVRNLNNLSHKQLQNLVHQLEAQQGLPSTPIPQGQPMGPVQPKAKAQPKQPAGGQGRIIPPTILGATTGTDNGDTAKGGKKKGKQNFNLTQQEIKALQQLLQGIQQLQGGINTNSGGGIPNPQPIPHGGRKGQYPASQNYPPAPVGNNQLYDPNPLKAYDAQNTPGSGFTSPFAGMGLLNPITGGTIDQPMGGMPQYLTPSPTFNLTYGQGPQQLVGNMPPKLSGGAVQQGYGVSGGAPKMPPPLPPQMGQNIGTSPQIAQLMAGLGAAV